MSKKILFLIILSVFTLSACSNGTTSSETTNSETTNGLSQEQVKVDSGKKVHTPHQTTSNTANSHNNSKNKVPKISYMDNPQVRAPTEVFTPSYREVQKSLANVLTQTAINLPQSKKRDAWYKQQIESLKKLKVSSCTPAKVGTPSICRASLDNKKITLHLILTQKGWVVINSNNKQTQ